MLRRGSLSGSVHERRDEVIVLNCHARPGHREMLDRAERSAVREIGNEAHEMARISRFRLHRIPGVVTPSRIARPEAAPEAGYTHTHT